MLRLPEPRLQIVNLPQNLRSSQNEQKQVVKDQVRAFPRRSDIGAAHMSQPLFFHGMKNRTRPKRIKLIIDKQVLSRYEKYYFEQHPKAKKPPIKQPYHESINVWMIMKRAMMNALKQKWKDFIKWFVSEQGYSNLHIDKCEISQKIYYPNHRRHDPDNSTPKFILDGLVESGMIVDDDSTHVKKITLECDIDLKNPRTELLIKVIEQKEK